MNSSNPPSTAP
uniref:Uncharacterized protein n=1 Tax=Lepeophtheirus salmonis TaxID=72036 RepID=A0A0K2ULQ5_LEPSM